MEKIENKGWKPRGYSVVQFDGEYCDGVYQEPDLFLVRIEEAVLPMEIVGVQVP